MDAAEQPVLPFGEALARPAPPPEEWNPEVPPGFAKIEYPDGRKRVGRLHCATDERRVLPCFQMEDVMDWFNPFTSVTSIGMGEAIRDDSDETVLRVAFRHGRTRHRWFAFCPFCGKNIRVALPSPPEAAAAQPAPDANSPTTPEIPHAP